MLGGDLTISSTISSTDAYSAVDLLVGEETGGRQLLSRLKIQAEWLQRVVADDTLANVYLATVNVVAGTCIGFLRNRAVRSLDFDLCIVDEASKATLTEALVPMSRARKWILVGDTNQLPPTDEDLLRASDILSERELTREDIVQTLFQRLADSLADHSQRMLTTQYRMIRPIGDLISTCFYDGKLYSPNTDGIQGYDKVFGRPVMWLDTGPLGDRRRESEPGGQATSFANRSEAKLAIDQLKRLDHAIDFGLVKLDDDDGPPDVLVISPYKSQVDELRRRVARVAFKHIKVFVMSVDSVQGREADVVVFSVTRSNEDGRLGFLGGEYWRRINVALSRARFGLIVIGDRSFIQGTTGALRQALDYIVRHPSDCEMRSAARG
jgi:superfamily I DNA and/or RNA helicase